MAALSRDQVKVPQLPEEEVPFPALGGNLLVRGLLMSRRLANDRLHLACRKQLEGETEDQAHARAGAQIVARLLHHAVVDPSTGEPLMSEVEWDHLGGTHRAEVFHVFNVAMRLNGDDVEFATKNSLPSPRVDLPSS